jgi:hypothetical protein
VARSLSHDEMGDSGSEALDARVLSSSGREAGSSGGGGLPTRR